MRLNKKKTVAKKEEIDSLLYCSIYLFWFCFIAALYTLI